MCPTNVRRGKVGRVRAAGALDRTLPGGERGEHGSATGRQRPYSFDTRNNSIAADRYLREDLDHVLHRTGHAQPSGWTNEAVEEQSAPWTVSSWGTGYTYTNLSDHYPVVASVR